MSILLLDLWIDCIIKANANVHRRGDVSGDAGRYVPDNRGSPPEHSDDERVDGMESDGESGMHQPDARHANVYSPDLVQ